MIGPGSSTAWYVHVARSNGFAGPVHVEVHGLPKGVTINPLTIPPAMTQGLLVLTAAPDAPARRPTCRSSAQRYSHGPGTEGNCWYGPRLPMKRFTYQAEDGGALTSQCKPWPLRIPRIS